MNRKPRVLISQCLLGIDCRYDGCCAQYPGLDALTALCELIPVCPEQLGGLTTPRDPAERKDGRVLTRMGADVTHAFERGAGQACRLAEWFGAEYALLKARSPSCGAGEIYDGSFTGKRTQGDGVTVQRLKAMGVRVYNETQLHSLIEQLEGDKR